MNSAAEKYIGRQKSLCTMQGVFEGNYQDLINTLSLATSPEYVIEKFSNCSSDTKNELHIELTRHLHNYLVSAASLIDHTRNLMKSEYKNQDIHKSYQGMINSEFVPCSTSAFIKDMRNYIAHKGTLPSKFQIGTSHEITCKYSLNTEKLKCWSNWSRGSKELLNIQTEEIDLLPLINFYSEKVFKFILWLNAELEKFHESDMVEFRKLRAY